jgi:hypothetical protein
MEAIRDYVRSSNAALKDEFNAMAGEGVTINVRSFLKGVQNMQLNLQQHEITAVFEALDVTGDGEIEWEEFRVAFKPSDANYQVTVCVFARTNPLRLPPHMISVRCHP